MKQYLHAPHRRVTGGVTRLLALALLSVVALTAQAQTSSFTYQGRLTDGGTPANGNYDLQFKLWDSLSGGSQIGATQTVSTVSVSSGVFSVTLDFGVGAFSGANRFLEISTRVSGGGAFILLTPREQITSTPYAVRSNIATQADTATNSTQLGGVAAGQFVQTSDSRLSDSRPPTAGSSSYIQNGTNPQSGNFNISGNGTAGGTLSGNAVNATTQYNIGGSRVLSAPGSANVFAGALAGNANSTGAGNSFFGAFAGRFNNADDNSFFGISAGESTTSGTQNSFFGFASGGTNVSGCCNSIFGYSAGTAATSSDNSFFGHSAGFSTTSGSANVFFGRNAGLSNTIGFSNTVIGTQANVGSGNLSNATAIGANAMVSQNNSVVLGSINGVNNANADTKVGIGTTTPTERLTVQTATSNFGFVHTDGAIVVGSFVGGSTVGGLYGTKSNHPLSFFVNNGAPSMTINTSGTVSIFSLGVAGSTTLCRNSFNQIAACSSSLRYKTNVQTFNGGMAVINRLRPISFTWKEGGVRDIGLGAEEVERVAPILTFRNDKGEIEGVRYNQLSAVFINAFKEQQTQIQQQQEQIKRQQDELSALRKLVCRSHPRAQVCRN